MKKEEGITLVALIITIIILIILAAITLQTVVVDGILNLASQGSINYSQAQSNEVSMLNDMNDNLQEVTSTLGEINADPDEGKDEPDSVYNVLKVGDYVQYYYDSSKDPILCKVLYDKDFNEKNSTKYGIQIVSIDENFETVTLGYEDPRIETDAPADVKSASKDTEDGKLTRAIWSYNNAIETLNKEGEKYLSKYVTGVRCIGTVPDAPSTEAEYFNDVEEWYKQKYNYSFKSSDDNVGVEQSENSSKRDWEQLVEVFDEKDFGSVEWNDAYWLGSRSIEGGTTFGVHHYYLDVRCMNPFNLLDGDPLWVYPLLSFYEVDSPDSTCGRSDDCYFMPVFTLKNGVKVENVGDDPEIGKLEEKPYLLGDVPSDIY